LFIYSNDLTKEKVAVSLKGEVSAIAPVGDRKFIISTMPQLRWEKLKGGTNDEKIEN
jgi:hypothetical protein